MWVVYSGEVRGEVGTRSRLPSFVVQPQVMTVMYPGIWTGRGSTNSVEDRENGDLGAVTP